MTTFIVLAAIATWCLLAFFVATAITRRMPTTSWRRPASVLVFALVFFLPVLDEIIGRFQFVAICRENSMIKVRAEQARGRTVHALSAKFEKVGGTVVPVVIRQMRFVDVRTGEVIVSFRQLTAYSGLLAQAIGFPGGGVPLTFDGSCSPAARGNLTKLFKKLDITLSYQNI